MQGSADSARRWFGMMFLAIAFGMLIWGQTVLKSRLTGKTFVVYWTLCFLFTGLAIIVSALEVRAIRKQSQAEHSDLVQRTLQDVKCDTHKGPSDQDPGPQAG